jgi:hypothetical protein
MFWPRKQRVFCFFKWHIYCAEARQFSSNLDFLSPKQFTQVVQTRKWFELKNFPIPKGQLTCWKQVHSFKTPIPKIALVLCIASYTILKVWNLDIHANFGTRSWALEEGIGYHMLQQSQLLELGQRIHILGSSPRSGDPTSLQASMLALERTWRSP